MTKTKTRIREKQRDIEIERKVRKDLNYSLSRSPQQEKRDIIQLTNEEESITLTSRDINLL